MLLLNREDSVQRQLLPFSRLQPEGQAAPADIMAAQH